MYKKSFIVLLAAMFAAGVAHGQGNLLKDGFIVAAKSIGTPAADGVSGTITDTGGSNYRVRSMGGVWWMIQNADKPLTKADGCTFNSINRGVYGHLYTWSGAEKACPAGWTLPADEDFKALSQWLTVHNKWNEWNSGVALGGYGVFGNYGGKQDLYARWWSNSKSCRRWGVDKGNTSGDFFTDCVFDEFSVRCIKK